MPLFAILMPCRNAAATLPAALASVSAQTERDWRAIVVDDGSTDETTDIVAGAAARDPRITAIRTEGVGPACARNLAAEAANAPWLACLDADDIWPADRLSALKTAIAADPAAAGFYGRCAFFAEDPDAPRALSAIRPAPLAIEDVLGENPTCTMSNLTVHAEAWRSVDGLDPRMIHAEDLDFLIRLIGEAGARIQGVDQVLTWYRTSPHGLSADLAAMEAGWRACMARARRFADAKSLARAEARQHRYLARRALRLGAPGALAARHALRGLAKSPAAFFDAPHRGAATLAAALAAPLTPRPLARALFA